MKQVIEENKTLVRSLIRKMLGFGSEDLEQEVYLKTWRSLSLKPDLKNMKGWITVITQNTCRDYKKNVQEKMRSQECKDDEVLSVVQDNRANAEELLIAKRRKQLILKAVDSLPRKMRQVVYLHDFEQMKYADVAEKLRISEGTVKSRLFYAHEMLREKLSCLKG